MKNNISIKTIIITLLLLMLMSCAKDKSTNPIQTEDLMPLVIGNSWTYYFSTSQDTIDFNVTVSSEIEIDSQSIQSYEVTIGNLTFRYHNESDGLYFDLIGATNSEGDPVPVCSALLAKHPVSQGEEWLYSYEVEEINTDYTIECISENILVETPAGSFNCIAYKSIHDLEHYYIEYYCPGIGLIKSENHQSDEYEEKILLLYNFVTD